MKIITVTKSVNGIIEGYMNLEAFFRYNPEYEQFKEQITNRLRNRKQGQETKEDYEKIFRDSKITLQRTEIQN